MKLSKLLIVPAVLVLGAVTAVPAWAHSATIANLTATCNSDHKVARGHVKVRGGGHRKSAP